MKDKEYNLNLKAGFKIGNNKICGKRTKYRSEETARKALFMRLERKKSQNFLGYYPCVFCGGWHIGLKMFMKSLIKYEKIELPKEKVDMLR